MCGIVGVISKVPANQLVYDALLLLQHRGQDAAGIVTMQGTRCFMHKASGMVRDVFRTRDMRGLPGNDRPRASALLDGGRRLQRRGSAAVLRQRAVRPGARAQRQPHQRRRSCGASCSRSTGATSTPRATPRCCSTCFAHELRTRERAACRSTPEDIFRRRARGARACARRRTRWWR